MVRATSTVLWKSYCCSSAERGVALLLSTEEELPIKFQTVKELGAACVFKRVERCGWKIRTEIFGAVIMSEAHIGESARRDVF